MTILEQVADTDPRVSYSEFSPSTPLEAFALRLAIKLNDRTAALHYAELAEHYPMAHLLVAYQRAAAHSHGGNLARRFHEFFEPLKHRDDQTNGDRKSTHKLAAIRVDRRAVAVAIFNGDHLAHAQSRQLCSEPGKAIGSAVDFIERIVAQFKVESAVFEAIPTGHERHRKSLQEAIRVALTQDEINVGEAAKADILDACAHPPVATRKQLREIASSIWPILDEQSGGPWTHDSAMLGLYAQIEAAFDNKEN